MRRLLVRLICLLACVGTCAAQEITLEEVKVEAQFIDPLELPFSRSLDQLVERLRLRDENIRAVQLEEANKSSVTRILDLSRFSPIPLGASESRVDTFLQENYMRPELNPREDKSLFDKKR